MNDRERIGKTQDVKWGRVDCQESQVGDDVDTLQGRGAKPP
jgi:hypothetical protein